jgi:hypothetical protein
MWAGYRSALLDRYLCLYSLVVASARTKASTSVSPWGPS